MHRYLVTFIITFEAQKRDYFMPFENSWSFIIQNQVKSESENLFLTSPKLLHGPSKKDHSRFLYRAEQSTVKCTTPIKRVFKYITHKMVI